MSQSNLVATLAGGSGSELTFGFYGKVPAVGDFVSREISAPQVECIDEWFKAGLAYIQSERSDWLDNYLVAPVWSFFMPAGCWGESALCGALMPSVDRVGRYYPLIAIGEVSEELLCAPAALYSRLADLSQQLPKLLQLNLMPDEVTALIHREGRLVNGMTNQVFCRALERIFLSTHASYWWVSASTPSYGVEHGVAPNDELFARLFSSS